AVIFELAYNTARLIEDTVKSKRSEITNIMPATGRYKGGFHPLAGIMIKSRIKLKRNITRSSTKTKISDAM
ncbi:MAG: hypothetical protein IKM51_01435, partial [Oscillospiraceae bacterium]|nr:hypothetical protein [Oscillospiraceae bacterium]